VSPHEKIRCQFSGSKTVIKLGIDVRQDFCVVAVHQESSDESRSIKCFFISLRSREYFPFYVNFSSARTTRRFPPLGCGPEIQTVRPLESMAEKQLHSALGDC